MIPQRFEYLFLLSILGLLLFAFLSKPLHREMHQPKYWWSLLFFLLGAIVLDAFAIQRGWWTFSEERLTGLRLATVPIEEYILMTGFHALVIGLWRLEDDME